MSTFSQVEEVNMRCRWCSLQEPATGIIDSEWFMHQASCVSVRALVLTLNRKGQKLFLKQLGCLCIAHIQTTAFQILRLLMNLSFLASEKG